MSKSSPTITEALTRPLERVVEVILLAKLEEGLLDLEGEPDDGLAHLEVGPLHEMVRRREKERPWRSVASQGVGGGKINDNLHGQDSTHVTQCVVVWRRRTSELECA